MSVKVDFVRLSHISVWAQRVVWALTQNQLTRSQRTRIGYFEIWNNSFISINLAYLREIWPPLVLSNWYLGTNFFGKGSDTSFASQVSPPLALCQLILSQGSNHPLPEMKSFMDGPLIAVKQTSLEMINKFLLSQNGGQDSSMSHSTEEKIYVYPVYITRFV